MHQVMNTSGSTCTSRLCHRDIRLAGRTCSAVGRTSNARKWLMRAGAEAPGVTSQSPKWQEDFVLENPLLSSAAEVFDVQGNVLPVRELGEGRTVVGLLRHLGCAMCWEQANNLNRLKPQLEALGFKLRIVAIGYPEGGKELCAKLPFPEDLLFLDPDRKVYTELHLHAGLKYFFNRDTWDGVRGLDQEVMKDAMKRYSFIRPPNAECTLQMGGLYVVDGAKLLYAHMDRGLGAHAPNSEVLAACGAAA